MAAATMGLLITTAPPAHAQWTERTYATFNCVGYGVQTFGLTISDWDANSISNDIVDMWHSCDYGPNTAQRMFRTKVKLQRPDGSTYFRGNNLLSPNANPHTMYNGPSNQNINGICFGVKNVNNQWETRFVGRGGRDADNVSGCPANVMGDFASDT